MSDLADRVEASAARLLEQLAGELWLPLCRRLRRSFPRAATDLVADASNDAILAYAARPQEFDVSRRVPLDHFLFGIAARILRDRLRSDKRRDVREGDYGKHILQAYGHQTDDRATSHVAVQEVRRARALVCNPTELAAVVAWLNEDDTGIVAVRLGLSHLPPVEQRREVKRFTARVIMRLRRHFRGGPSCLRVEKSEWLTSDFAVWRLIHH